MKPAPRIPTLLIGITGDESVPSMLATPGSFFSAVVAKKRNISCFETSVIAISPNSLDSSR
jgi:hypothetical protein